jgi:hypothetical protein
MADEVWYDYFMDTMATKYPKKTELAKELMDLLNVEREAIYRRLRKEVVFPAHEIVKIAAAWSISLDEIIGVNAGKVFFQMQPMNFLNPSKREFSNLQKRVRAVDVLKNSPDSEYMDVCNKLPRSLTAGFPFVYKFEIFKWSYQYYHERTELLFSQAIVPEKVRREIAEFHQNIKYTANTSFIFDSMIFEYLISDIHYFHSILLITDEEKEEIKQDLLRFLDYLLEIANKGYYPETKKKVTLYISKININTNYSYYHAEKLKICRIHVFGKYDISTYDPEMITNFVTWMQLKKRTSVQISEVDAKGRVEFFSKQQQLIENL